MLELAENDNFLINGRRLQYRTSWIYRAFGISFFLHVFLITNTYLFREEIRLQSNLDSTHIKLRLSLPTNAHIKTPTESVSSLDISPVQTRFPNLTQLSTSTPKLPKRVSKESSDRTTPSRIVKPPNVIESPVTPSVQLTQRKLQVAELLPETIQVPLDLGDGSVYWHNSSTLRKLPLAINTPELELPQIDALPAELAPVQMCIRINLDGTVHGIQILSPPNPMDEALAEKLSGIRFTPGEDRFGHAVPSLMILEFWLESSL